MRKYNVLLKKAPYILESIRKTIQEDPSNQKNSQSELVKNAWIDVTQKKNAGLKTKIFETIPLIFAVSTLKQISSGGDYKSFVNDMIDILNDDYDWDASGKTWLLNLANKIKRNSNACAAFYSIVIQSAVKAGGQSLKDINGGKKVSSFIHGSIGDFYKKLKASGKKGEDSKEFTADVVLIWGSKKAEAILKSNSLGAFDVQDDSTVLLGDKKTKLAAVSLKALKGRVGKNTKYWNKFMQSSNEGIQSVNESPMNFIKNAITKAKNVGSTAMEKIKNVSDKFTDWATNTIDSIKDIFTPSNPEVDKAKTKNDEINSENQEILNAFDDELIEHFNKSGRPITEASDTEPIQISNCFRDKLLNWYSKFDNDIKKYNDVFIAFNKKISAYSKTTYFRFSFKSLDSENREYQRELKRIQKVIETVRKAKEQKSNAPVSKKTSCKLLTSAGKPLMFTRAEIQTLLASNANYIGLEVFNNMIDQYLNKNKSKKPEDAIASLIQFATGLNAESIFGGVSDIPLIKYDGGIIVKYGTRKNYESEHSKKMIEHFKSDNKLPIVAIKVYPPNKKDGISTYYTLRMYVLSDFVGYEDKPNYQQSDDNFIYTVNNFKCNSGSTFVFVVEGDTVEVGSKVISSLNTGG